MARWLEHSAMVKPPILSREGLALYRHANHRQHRQGGHHPRQMGRTAGPCDDLTFKPRSAAALA